MSGVVFHRDYRDFDLRRVPAAEPWRAPAPARRGILRRVLSAIARWDDRRLEQEAARFIARNGGRFTDDIERQLGERFLRGR